jgi:hypothetical protein
MKLTNFSGGKTKADEKNQLPKLLIRQVKQIQNKTKENKKEPAANAPDPSSYLNKNIKQKQTDNSLSRNKTKKRKS